MYKTRFIRHRSNRSLTSASSSAPSTPDLMKPAVPKTLFKSQAKSPTVRYSLGVTYKVQHIAAPTNAGPPSPQIRCRKCKHPPNHHKVRPAVKTPSFIRQSRGKDSLGISSDHSLGLGAPGTVWSPDSGSLVEQFKANIAISPYVRHYLERKLKNKLIKEGKGGPLSRLVPGQLELVYNMSASGKWHDSDSVGNSFASLASNKAKTSVIPGKTRIIRRLSGHTLPKANATNRLTNFKLKSSIDRRQGKVPIAGTNKAITELASGKSHKYFTRTQARLMATGKEHQEHALSSKASVPDDLFESPLKVPPTLKTRTVSRKVKTMPPKKTVLTKLVVPKSKSSVKVVPKQTVTKQWDISTSLSTSGWTGQSLKPSVRLLKSKLVPADMSASSRTASVTPVTSKSRPVKIKSKIPRYTGDGLPGKE